MNQRQIAASKKRQKLIDTALMLLKEKGFDAINVEEITQKAGVAKGTFYNHFKRKEDIIVEISKAPFLLIFEKIESMQGEPFLKILNFYIHNFMDAVEYYSIHTCREWLKDVLNPNVSINGKNSKKWFSDLNDLSSLFVKAINDNKLSKDIPYEKISTLIIVQLYGMTTSFCMSDNSFSPKEWIDDMFNLQVKPLIEPYLSK